MEFVCAFNAAKERRMASSSILEARLIDGVGGKSPRAAVVAQLRTTARGVSSHEADPRAAVRLRKVGRLRKVRKISQGRST